MDKLQLSNYEPQCFALLQITYYKGSQNARLCIIKPNFYCAIFLSLQKNPPHSTTYLPSRKDVLVKMQLLYLQKFCSVIIV